MFEKYLKRADPREMLQSLQVGGGGAGHQRQAYGSVATLSSQSDTGGLTGGGGSRMSRKSRSKSRTSGADRSLRLSAEQKCDIAQREIDEYQTEVRKMNEEAEKVLDNLRVSN